MLQENNQCLSQDRNTDRRKKTSKGNLCYTPTAMLSTHTQNWLSPRMDLVISWR